MDKDTIILLEDESAVRKGFRDKFEDLELNKVFELIECPTYDEYYAAITDPYIKSKLKCIIMDLSNNKTEVNTREFKASEYISDQYKHNRIPIFVHSAYLESYNELEDKGTVFKINKGGASTIQICNTIKLMKDSDFFNIFCVNGSLEKKIMSEIHRAFVEQFKGKEIEEIIKSITKSYPANHQTRTTEVFERIALRAVYQNVLVPVGEEEESVKVNAIEHYYRRSSKFEIWTGDVFEEKSTKQKVFIATPRCNLANSNYTEILICTVKDITKEQATSFLNPKEENKLTGETKGLRSLRMSITDDVTNSFIGERFRFLPCTPQFSGGFVDLKEVYSIKKEEILENYIYKISVIDDLANDVIRKLASYLLRGGISDSAYKEAQFYLNEIVNKPE